MTVSDVCKTTYEEIKKDKKHRYVIFFIRDEKQIDVEVVGDRNAEYEQFLEDIQKGGTGECRYVSITIMLRLIKSNWSQFKCHNKTQLRQIELRSDAHKYVIMCGSLKG